MPISQVFQELACTPAGLTEAEARQRVERFGPNRLPQVKGPGPLRRLLAQFDSVLVVGMGWLTIEAGSSMPLGAFLAGLLLSETEYRHQVEADIRPFRGLLLGLFFMTVGLSMDLGLVSERLTDVLIVVLGLLTLKAALIFVLSLAFRLPAQEALRAGFLLAQGGEFAFVLFVSRWLAKYCR